MFFIEPTGVKTVSRKRPERFWHFDACLFFERLVHLRMIRLYRGSWLALFKLSVILQKVLIQSES